MPAPEHLPITIRVFSVRAKGKSEPKRLGPPYRPPKRTYPREALVWDPETRTDPAQRATFGFWRFFRERTDTTRPGPVLCIEEGIFCADDLPKRDPQAFALIRRYAAEHEAEVRPGYPLELGLLPLSKWMQTHLFRYGYQHRDRCDLVGFNSLFDFGSVAQHWSPATGDHRGAWSLGLWGQFDEAGNWHDLRYHPRLIVKAIDPRRSLFTWGSLTRGDGDGKGNRARIADLHQTVFSLTDGSFPLDGERGACAQFGKPYIKPPVDYEVIDERMLDYARDDTRHTGILYQDVQAELRRHVGVRLQAHELFSPATVGVRYLEAMGLRRPLEKFLALNLRQLGWQGAGVNSPHPIGTADVTRPRALRPEPLGWAMGGFFGGRAEARIVRTVALVVPVDATSMYSLVNGLLGSWRLLIAAELREVNATQDVRALLADPRLTSKCSRRRFWKDAIGVTLVELEHIEGAVLPVRAKYDPRALDPGIGVNPLYYRGRLWYLLPDVIASVVLGGTGPRVRRAVRLRGVGRQAGLRPVQLRGGPWIDPARDDPFVAMINERQRIKADLTISKDERERLERFLKVTASATAYGGQARFDRHELAGKVDLLIYGPDARPLTKTMNVVEDPGPYSFPPIAASITAGARLMLALLERQVVDQGGKYVYCDTDAMAIVATREGGWLECPTPDGSGRVRALSFAQVNTTLARFVDLNPFDRAVVPEIWKVEHGSMTTPLWCYATSAKRYALFHRDPDGAPDIVLSSDDANEGRTADPEMVDDLEDWSEHGLGLYRSPLVDERGKPLRDARDRLVWIREAWAWTLGRALGQDPALPSWVGAYALTRFSLSSPEIAEWFAGHDAGVEWGERLRPGSFGLMAHPLLKSGPRPAARFESDPGRWPGLAWYDRGASTSQPIRVMASDPSMDADQRAHLLSIGFVPIRTLGDVLQGYSKRPEHKSLAPDGSKVTGETVGLLRRRPVASHPAITGLSGKEGNKLTERMAGATRDPKEYRSDYGTRADPWTLTLSVLRDHGPSAVAARCDVATRTIQRALSVSGPARPRAQICTDLTAVAVQLAREGLGAALAESENELATLQRYLDLPKRARARRCACGCGRGLAARQRKWFSEGCRLAAHRRTAPSKP